MKEFKENQDMYSVPRINAWTASIIANRLEEVYEQEIFIELCLNNVMSVIWEAVEDKQDHVTIDFKGDIDDALKMEVINRLEDLSYVVKMGVDSEEEVDLFLEYEEMAKEDESINDILDEAYCSSNCYVIFWNHVDIEGMGDE